MNNTNNMPNINELDKFALSPGRHKTPARTSSFNSNDWNKFNNVNKLHQNNWNKFVRNLQNSRPPRYQKIAPLPRAKSPRAQSRVSSPDRKFAHLFQGTNSGEKDSHGRIIYHGPRGGKYVISSIGKRVPHVDENLKKKSNGGEATFTGKLDRKGRKIFRGKQGGEYVITNSGRRANPLK
jgi:hypothetical protein